jgi:hypothetical protein
MFKTLASFFKPKGQATEETQEETPEVKPEETPEETPEQTPEETPKETPEETPSANAGISTERYNALLAAEAELKKFGATAEARADFLAETKQLYTWYNNVKSVGVKAVAQDANQEQKGKAKAKSSVTKEAEALEAKRAVK